MLIPNYKLHFFLKVILLLTFIVVDETLKAQNLVLNPSFEDHSPCRSSGDGTQFIRDCKYWTFGDSLADKSESAYCTSCSNNYFKPPWINLMGYQYPRTGSGMIFLFNNYNLDTTNYFGSLDGLINHNYREFINGTLSNVLTKGTVYHIGCYVNLSDSSSIATDNFGIYISDSLMDYDKLGMVAKPPFNIPQISNPSGKIISDTLGWTLLDGMYQAKGTEKYLCLGSYKDDQHSVCSKDLTKKEEGYSNSYFIDDVFVIPINFPTLAQSHDTIICPGTRITLHTTAGHGFSQQWQDGSKGDSFIVSDPGIYWVSFDTLGYSVRDSVKISYYQITSGIPGEIVTCSFPNTLSAPVDSMLTYYWPDGSSGFQYIAAKPEMVYYNLKSGKCMIKDSILLVDAEHFKPILPKDTSFCTHDSLIMNLSGIGNDITWQDNSTSKIYPITTPGSYKLYIKTACGNVENDMNVFEGDCHCNLWIPNAFSPDSNGTNDIFKCVNACPMEQFELQVYNRLGVKVFQTDNIQTNWDGNYHGTPCADGIYVYNVHYQFVGQPAHSKIGNIELLAH